jgi:hypothetical protein
MSERITLTLPLPPRECSPNYHGHWRKGWKAGGAYRQTARHLCMEKQAEWAPIQRAGWPIRISAEFYCGLTPPWEPKRYRPLDITNAIQSLQQAVNGIVDAGIVPNDTHRYVTWGEVKLYRTRKEHDCRAEVVLTIEAVTAEPLRAAEE